MVHFEGADDDVSVPLLRQRRRLAERLSVLDDEAWATPSRCEGWTVRDVVDHLVSTNGFWALSIGAGRAGEPTQVLAGFDPVATPAALVAGGGEAPPGEVLAAYAESTEAIATALAGLDGEAWEAVGEAPPGHVSLRAVALHALWDAWIHERDVLVPLGLAQDLEDDEVAACLRYAAALGPGLLAMYGSERPGCVAVQARDPEVQVVVELGPTAVVRTGEAPPDGAAVLRGPAVDLVEALSFRGPFPEPLDPDTVWMLGALAEAFDTTLEVEAARHA